MQVPKDPHGTQLYWEYLVPADGIGAAKLARTETSVCLCFMGSSQTSHRLPARHIWGFRGKSQATPAVPIAPRPSLVRLKVERKDLAWVPVPPRAGRYLIITLRFLLTLSVGFSCLFRQPECS